MADLTISNLDLDLIRKIRANHTVRKYRFGNVGSGIYRAMVDLTSNRVGDEFSISFHRAFKNLEAAKRYAKLIRSEITA